MPMDLNKFQLPLSDSRWDRLAFRVEHWLLSAGASDVAKLRGYLRVKAWRDCTSAADRLHAVKLLLKLPARAARDSWRAVSTYGADVARESDVARSRQWLQLWWVWVRHGVQPETYYRYQLYRPGQLRRAPSFLQKTEASDLYRLLSARVAPDSATLLRNKARFEQWLVDRGLPTVRTLMEFVDGAVVRSCLADGALPRGDLFSKLSDSSEGYGAQRWQYADGGWVGADGRRRDEQELIAELAELSKKHGVLVQEYVRNHPALAPLAPAALSTVRLLTLRDVDGTVRLVLAVAKIPTGSAATDHMRLGGLAAPVDLATGRLGRAVRKDERRFVSHCEQHPDTGARIEGVQLPHWETTKRLVVRAHEALDHLVAVGWDVAILENGPIIIEGNDSPGSASSQMPSGVPLGETPVVPVLAAHLRAAFAGAPRTPPHGARRAESVHHPA